MNRGRSRLVTIPSPLPPERDPGVVDVTPDTLADRDVVTDIRDHVRRNRNAPKRAPEPEKTL